MEEVEEIHQSLMQRIEEIRLSGAKGLRRELRTSRSALRALKALLEEMRLSA